MIQSNVIVIQKTHDWKVPITFLNNKLVSKKWYSKMFPTGFEDIIKVIKEERGDNDTI